jgi:4-aminobutyrate aminotransferase-like enzyme
MEVCKARKVVVWDDEIQTFGRLPTMFAYEYFNLGEYVDVFCVGKMTQACATMWTEEMNPKGGLLSGTFTGEGVSFRIGQRVVERLRDGNYYGPQGSIARHHALFREQVQQLIARHPTWFPAVEGQSELLGGLGGMMKFTPFAGKKDKINALCKACFEEGVILFYCGHGPFHVRMLPPLGIMKEQDWPRVFACIERGLAKVAG